METVSTRQVERIRQRERQHAIRMALQGLFAIALSLAALWLLLLLIVEYHKGK